MDTILFLSQTVFLPQKQVCHYEAAHFQYVRKCLFSLAVEEEFVLSSVINSLLLYVD